MIECIAKEISEFVNKYKNEKAHELISEIF